MQMSIKKTPKVYKENLKPMIDELMFQNEQEVTIKRTDLLAIVLELHKARMKLNRKKAR